MSALQQFLICGVRIKGEPAEAFHKRVLHLRLLTVSEVEVVGGAGGPQPHGVHRVVHVPGDGRVVRHRQDDLPRRGVN